MRWLVDLELNMSTFRKQIIKAKNLGHISVHGTCEVCLCMCVCVCGGGGGILTNSTVKISQHADQAPTSFNQGSATSWLVQVPELTKL